MITTSLELSKRLKEAGFPQDIPDEYGDEQSRWWCQWGGKAPTLLWLQSDGFNNDGTYGESGEIEVLYKSFFAEEIIEKLPKILESSGDYFFLNCHRDGQWLVSYYSMLQDYKCYINDERIAVYGESLSDTCALMYLHLKEHNLL